VVFAFDRAQRLELMRLKKLPELELRNCSRRLLGLLAVVVCMAPIGTAAAASTPRAGRYTGASYKGAVPKGLRRMQIELDVGKSGSTWWWVDYLTPCTNRSVETGDPARVPRVQIRNGRFSLQEHVFVKATQIDMRFRLVGRVSGSGFRGTFRATEKQYGHTCASGLLHWTARPGWNF
jgi:hypothetical protein